MTTRTTLIAFAAAPALVFGGAVLASGNLAALALAASGYLSLLAAGGAMTSPASSSSATACGYAASTRTERETVS